MSVFDDYFDEEGSEKSDVEEEGLTFDPVEVVKETDKAWLIRFPNKPVPHWVPKSQAKLHRQTLTVEQWLRDKWEEEGWDPDKEEQEDQMEIPDCLCLRETDAALYVDVPSHGRLWFPRGQVLAESEIQQDGDQGTLVVTKWIYEQKFGKDGE